MEFGLFLEFPRQEGGTDHDAFRDAFHLVDRAEEQGVDSVWLAEYHFNPGRVLIGAAFAGAQGDNERALPTLALPLDGGQLEWGCVHGHQFHIEVLPQLVRCSHTDSTAAKAMGSGVYAPASLKNLA